MSNHPATPHSGDEHGGAHVVPLWVLMGVFVVLIALTFLTVAATWVNLGSWNLLLALAIATVKGTLVVLFFMHLWYDRPFNALVFGTALLFLALFLFVTLLDTKQYQDTIRSYQEAFPQPTAPAPKM